MMDCHIKFNDNSLSRYQCEFKWIQGRWAVIDGTEKKASTNGTWVFLDEFTEITPGMIIKIG